MSRRQLEDAVEPLIDAISSLVLAAATNSLDTVKESCENISKYTLEVVETAKDEAIASNDIDVQIDLTKAINDIATTIENLVASFNRMFASPNKDTQRAFAKGAKDTGDAIQALLICADMTYLRKITEAVDFADKNALRLKNDCRGSKEQLVKAAQANADGIVKVVKLAIKASDATLDKNKSNLLKNVGDSIKQLGPGLIQQAKAVNMDPHNGANASAMENGYSELRYSFDQLLEYARIMGNYIGKIGEAWEAAQRLLEMARQMEAAALALKKAAYSGSREDFLAAAKRAAAIALELLKAAEAALLLEKDPIKRKILASAIEDLRNASKALIAAAQAVHADPNNPQKRQALEDAHTELSRCIERVLALTDPNSSPASTFYHVADFLERTAGDVRDDGKKADRPKLVDDAHTLAATALHFVKVTDNLADTMVDQDDRHKLKGIAREVKTAADNLNSQADKVAGNPANAGEVKELDKQYHNLQNLLDDARRAAGFVVNRPRQGEPEPPPPKPEPPAPGPPVKKAEVDFQKGENELVTAAKQQALEALKIAEDAEKFAHTLDDAKKKQEILEAAGHLRRVAHEVIAAAEDVARNPNDPDKQRILVEKQKDLTAAISKVIGLTMAMQEDIARAMRELEALLAESEALFHEFFAACKACQSDVDRDFIAKQGRKSPGEMVGSAKNLSNHAANISRLLKEISAKSSDKQFKNQCDSAAKYIRDKSLQCKMISAVKAATTADEVDDNQVSSAAKGLSAEVGESVKAVRAGLLKRRLQSTQQQTLAIKKIRDLWNQHRNKFL